MKTAVLGGLALLTVASVNATLPYTLSGFSPGATPLDWAGDGDGSFAGDIYQHPGYQEIGGRGQATTSGIAYSEPFAPVDLSFGHGGEFGWFTDTTTTTVPNPGYDPEAPPGPFNPLTITTTTTTTMLADFLMTLYAAPGTTAAPWRFSLYDSYGGSAYMNITPSAAPGQFGSYMASSKNFVGNLRWDDVMMFSIGGMGGTEPFHAAFDDLSMVMMPVPEPQEWAAVAGGALVAFALARRVRRAPAV